MHRFLSLFGSIIILIISLGNFLAAQDRGNPNWYVRVAPYLWYSNLAGSETLSLPPADNIVGDFRVPVGDKVLKNNWAGRFELGKARVRGVLNISRANSKNPSQAISLSDSSDTHPVHYDFTWFTTEAFAAVQIGPFKENFAFELYGGGRYVNQKQNVAATDGSNTNISINETWVEPLFGFRLFSELGKRWWASFHTDLGGFGAGSEYTWTLGGELGLRVVKFLDVSMRYNYQETEYNNKKEGSQRYTWDDAVQQGWFFGLIFKR